MKLCFRLHLKRQPKRKNEIENEERYNCFGNHNISRFVLTNSCVWMEAYNFRISLTTFCWPELKVAKKEWAIRKKCNDRNSFMNKIWGKFCRFYLCANVQQFWHPNYRQGQNKISVRYHDATPTVKRYTDDNDCVLYFTQPPWSFKDGVSWVEQQIDLDF